MDCHNSKQQYTVVTPAKNVLADVFLAFTVSLEYIKSLLKNACAVLTRGNSRIAFQLSIWGKK